MKTTMLVFLMGILSSGVIFADDFDKLEKKQKSIEAANPFASKKAVCINKTDSGVEIEVRWTFFSHGVYFSELPAAWSTAKGKYTVEAGVLKVVETERRQRAKKTPSDRTFDYKYKIIPGGFQYIHEVTPDSKHLYICKWSGKT